jgi:glycosyltransferase involved in cell wall biosynthesis
MRRIGGDMSPEVSIVLCTWNRAALLGGALDALLNQAGAPAYEVLVVDNASTDRTPSIISEAARRDPRLRALVEPRQGLAHARNRGVTAALAPVIAFTDDDVRVPDSWVRTIVGVFARRAAAAYAGGPVVPTWPDQVPAWLTTRHWAPLGIQDYGAAPLRIDSGRPLCLIGANLVVRREALAAVGPFDPLVQRVRDGSGSTEDQEWQQRAWASGRHGAYEPSLRVAAVVTPDRVRKAHHRAWHFGHGRHVARMRLADIEASRLRPFGMPLHLWRSTAVDAWQWALAAARGDAAAAFDRETRLCFAAGFLRERIR